MKPELPSKTPKNNAMIERNKTSQPNKLTTAELTKIIVKNIQNFLAFHLKLHQFVPYKYFIIKRK